MGGGGGAWQRCTIYIYICIHMCVCVFYLRLDFFPTTLKPIPSQNPKPTYLQKGRHLANRRGSNFSERDFPQHVSVHLQDMQVIFPDTQLETERQAILQLEKELRTWSPQNDSYIVLGGDQGVYPVATLCLHIPLNPGGRWCRGPLLG